MNKKEAKGDITWIDNEVVGYQCECGEEITINNGINESNICPSCGRRYVLEQVNTIWKIEKDVKNLAK